MTLPLPLFLRRWAVQFGVCLAFALLACGGPERADSDAAPPAAASTPVTVFAAASTTDVMIRLARRYQAATGVFVRCNFASSSTLARQIESGAPADLFFSADEVWMDHVERLDRIEPNSRRDLLGNSLVLVAPAGRPFAARMDGGFDLPNAFEGRIAIGDPAHVPAGRYAQQALRYFGWWEKLERRILPAMDVRDALRLVAIDEAPAGIVYATDAASIPGVAVLDTFPEASHDPIRYPIALLRGASAPARGFLEFLEGAEAASVFETAGFRLIGRAD